jgi:uncharacterized protein
VSTVHESAVVAGTGAAAADEPVDAEVVAALARLEAVLEALAPVVVAFSGGADSAFLAAAARRGLGRDRARAATAVSPSLASAELEDCRGLAEELDLDWHPVPTTELDDPAYVRNDADRCARCKDALMDALEALLAAPEVDTGPATVVLGVNLDDLGDHRPGQAAAAARGARFPLVEAGFTKAMVRRASQAIGLRTWDKPAAACLASRLPYGVPVTMGRLAAVESAEAGLHRLGFAALRVRHYDDTARIEVPVDDLARVVAHRDEVVAAVRAAGYRYVTLDLEGLRSGNLNQALPTVG